MTEMPLTDISLFFFGHLKSMAFQLFYHYITKLYIVPRARRTQTDNVSFISPETKDAGLGDIFALLL